MRDLGRAAGAFVILLCLMTASTRGGDRGALIIADSITNPNEKTLQDYLRIEYEKDGKTEERALECFKNGVKLGKVTVGPKETVTDIRCPSTDVPDYGDGPYTLKLKWGGGSTELTYGEQRLKIMSADDGKKYTDDEKGSAKRCADACAGAGRETGVCSDWAQGDYRYHMDGIECYLPFQSCFCKWNGPGDAPIPSDIILSEAVLYDSEKLDSSRGDGKVLVYSGEETVLEIAAQREHNGWRSCDDGEFVWGDETENGPVKDFEFDYTTAGILKTAHSYAESGTYTVEITCDRLIDEKGYAPRKFTFAVEVKDMPEKFDLKKYVSPTWDQGSCGSCWAFATVDLVESVYNEENNLENGLDLSEQDLLSCYGTGCHDGGDLDDALWYVKKRGVAAEKCFPYAAQLGDDNPCSDKDKDCMEYYTIDEHGPVAGSVTAIKKRLLAGRTLASCMNYHSFDSNKHVCTTQRNSNHCILIAGYDDTIENGDGSKGAWIVKTNWGIMLRIKYLQSNILTDGYYYVAYNSCNILDEVYYVKGVHKK